MSKPNKDRQQQRTRLNPLTGKTETLPGTKAGPKRFTEPYGSPLRTHDQKPSTVKEN